MRACSTVVLQLCPLPWTSSSSTAPGLNQNADALLKALDRESRLLKKSLRLRNEEYKRDFLQAGSAQVRGFGVTSVIVLWLFMSLDARRPLRPLAWAGGRCCRRPWRRRSGADLGEAVQLYLRETANCLRPAEAFLDALAQPLADRIARARGDLARDGGLARLAMLAQRPVDRDMRLNPARLQALDEGLGVIALSAPSVAPLGKRWLKVAAASRSAVPVASVASAAATSPLRFSISA